jgi:hypothetical protein
MKGGGQLSGSSAAPLGLWFILSVAVMAATR